MEKKKRLISVAIATFNEQANLGRCLASVASWVDEIVVVDGGSTDRTVEIAKQYASLVIRTDNPGIFHINKQKAVDACRNLWILQLEADEEVSKELADEIGQIVVMSTDEIQERVIDPHRKRLYQRHQRIIEDRDGTIGSNQGEFCAFYIPRLNYFLGHPLRYAGTYPDGVVRLFRKDNAWFPKKSVHEQIHVDGNVGWLSHDLYHYSNSTLGKYLSGADSYTSLLAGDLKEKHVGFSIVNVWYYNLYKPVITFFNLFIRHKGILDGIYGFLFSLFSALHYPVAYYKCLKI